MAFGTRRNVLLAIALSVFPLICSNLAAQQYSFEYLGQEQGLGSSLVRAIAQDRDGYLWIGTRAGLYRYDGLRFTAFGAAEGLTEESIRGLHLSRDGELWVITSRKAARFRNGRFESIDVETHDARAMSMTDSDRKGNVYFASDNGLLVRRRDGSVAKLALGDALQNNPVHGVYVDRDDSLWMDCNNRICHWDGTKTTAYSANDGVPRGAFTFFLRDSRGTLWARGNDVLLRLSSDGKRFERDAQFQYAGSSQLLEDTGHQLLAPTDGGLAIRQATGAWSLLTEAQGLPAERIRCLFSDREGSLWLGFSDLGVARWRGRGEWQSWNRSDGLSDSAISAITQTRDGAVWAGSRVGLNRMDPGTGKWQVFRGANGLTYVDVRDMTLGRDGKLWVASTLGLMQVDPASPAFHEIKLGGENSVDRMLSLHTDSHGTVWACTRRGVYASNSGQKFERMFANVLQSDEEIYAIRRTADGVTWMVGTHGLIREQAGKISRYDKKDGLRGQILVLMTLGKDNSVWVGYGDHFGASRVVWNNGAIQLQHFNTGSGLTSNDMCTMATDSKGWIWIGTDNGVNVYNGTSWRHISTHDGLIWHDVVLNGFHEDRNGGIWIGTNRGLSHYVASEPLFRNMPVSVLITDLRSEAKSLSSAKQIHVAPQAGLQITFNTMSFARQHEARFRYRLHGVNQEWMETDSHQAVYPNLPPGAYKFEVQAGVSGSWNPASAFVSFAVDTPWWRTPWAAGFGMALLLVIGSRIYIRRIRRIEGQQQRLEAAVEERTKELQAEKNRTEREKQIVELQKQEIEELLSRATEASRLKGEFLANVSHEIRTPMNGILGMTSLALETPLRQDQREYLDLVKASGESLLSLLNDILDFSKIEANRLELENLPFNLRGRLQEIVRTLAVAAQEKSLRLELEFAPDVPDSLAGDPIRLRQILLNLISNAIKFTTEGSIRVRVFTESIHPKSVVIRFHVIDTGEGIPEEKRSIIFEAFRQADGSTTRKYGGTGLGLAICSRLVDMMHGRIWVNSQVGLGSEFIFTAEFDLASAAADEAPQHAHSYSLGKLAKAVEKPGKRSLHILLAEDNVINQMLVVRFLERAGHTVEVVADGRLAVDLTAQRRFDVILMDVQMPQLDGLEATRLIRIRETTTGDHLPILMLTASAMLGDKERCLEAGADGYLPKPVSPEQLIAAVTEISLLPRQ